MSHSLSWEHASGIDKGTVCISKMVGPIFESIDSWKQIGELTPGEQLTAAGAPQISDGFLMVPIEPRGAVEAALLRFWDPTWRCHEWDFSDEAQPGYEDPLRRKEICERKRSDGNEHKYTYGNPLAAPGCSGCLCCERPSLESFNGANTSYASMRRLLGNWAPASIAYPNPERPEHPLLALTTTTTTTTRTIDLVVITTTHTTTTTTRDLVVVTHTTTTTTSSWKAGPGQVFAPNVRGSSSGFAACLEGDTCAYSEGWCTAITHEPLKPKGYCTRGKCNGPANIHTFPNNTCGSPHLPSFNVSTQLAQLPGIVHSAIFNITWLNRLIYNAFIWRGMHNLTLELDEVLTHSFDFELPNSSGHWLVGCWPPQRFVVTDGIVRFPAGRVKLGAGGINLIISLYDVLVKFKNLRVDLECHGGTFYLQGVGEGAEGRTVRPESITTSGEVTVECESSVSLLCLLLRAFKPWLTSAIMQRMPAFVAGWLGGISEMQLGWGGCPDVLHNTFTLLPYESLECCEDQFTEDAWGCLVGGQFNGRHKTFRETISGIRCQRSRVNPRHFTAKCEEVPGQYHEKSPGVCEEVAMPYGELNPDNKGWDRVRAGLHRFVWADWLLTMAVVWSCLLGCCLCSLCFQPDLRELERLERCRESCAG